jgi:hypothetical protein
MLQNHARNLTPPGKGQTFTSGTYSKEDKEEVTSPGDNTFILGQQFFVVFDNLSPEDQQLSIVLINAFAAMSPVDRKVLVAAAEKFAGI